MGALATGWSCDGQRHLGHRATNAGFGFCVFISMKMEPMAFLAFLGSGRAVPLASISSPWVLDSKFYYVA